MDAHLISFRFSFFDDAQHHQRRQLVQLLGHSHGVLQDALQQDLVRKRIANVLDCSEHVVELRLLAKASVAPLAHVKDALQICVGVVLSSIE